MTARLIEATRQFQSRLKDFFDNPLRPDAKPLEICEAVVDEIERKVQPVGRGRKVFPYDRVVVRVAQVSADRHALDAAFADLESRLRRRFREVQCEVPDRLDVNTIVLPAPPDGWPEGRLFCVELDKDTTPRPAVVVPAQRHASVVLTVTKGTTPQETYRFSGTEITLGRTEETTDSHGRIRRNDDAFEDVTDGITETVGRAHARIEQDPGTGDYLLFDEGSSNGTTIVRHGATLHVPSRDPRGIRIQSGDEVRLGRAVLSIAIDWDA